MIKKMVEKSIKFFLIILMVTRGHNFNLGPNFYNSRFIYTAAFY